MRQRRSTASRAPSVGVVVDLAPETPRCFEACVGCKFRKIRTSLSTNLRHSTQRIALLHACLAERLTHKA